MAEESMQLKEVMNEVDKIIVNAKKTVIDPTATAGTTAENTVTEAQAPAADIKTMSDSQLILFLQQEEIKKQQERLRRMLEKKSDVEKDHKFWKTQPVPALSDEIVEGNEPIDTSVTLETVRKEPYNMPAGFEWCSIDVTDEIQVLQLYNLLNENYVEDDECMFRFDYSIPFLRWALTQPGFIPDWHLGVRNSKTGNLMGCITAVPVHVKVYDKVVPMAEINFLCVHKKLRTKRLAPVLIKEITRRVNVTDRWQAVYTAGIVLPKPISRCRYHHRSLNPKKLIEVKFSSLPPRTSLANHLKTLKLPARTNHHLRPMLVEDVAAVHKLLTAYLEKNCKLYQVFTEDDVAHNLLPREKVVSSYVLEGENGEITDFCSYYYLPSTVIKNPHHSMLNAVYSYYNVATSMTVLELMSDLLVLAKNDGADVFNALDLMENKQFFEQLKFGMGDGFLQYYVYNWKCPGMKPEEVGIVLL